MFSKLPTPPAPLISVVVAAYNSADTLAGCIDSLLGQSYSPIEILIVDDGSTDGTAELLANHPAKDRFIALQLENGGPSRARNEGVRRARGELIAFFDSDCRLHPHCIEALHAALGDAADVASVGGMQCSPDDDSLFAKDVQKYFESIGFMTGYIQKGDREGAVDTPHNPSCNVLYRRSVFEKVGGFDEKLWPGEDFDLDHRVTLAGFRHLFEGRAIVYHHRPSSFAAFVRMMRSYGRAQMLLVRRHGFVRRLHLVPPAALLAAVVCLLAALLWPAPTVLALAICGVAALFVLERLRSRSRLGFSFYRFFFLNTGAWLLGFFEEAVRPRFGRHPVLVEFPSHGPS